ncbi:MAG TPA: hypothetical protein VKU41_07295 [Polyangiaceae bacterium]|nr:hypothetical protein [Polyangiaceae bacterium]
MAVSPRSRLGRALLVGLLAIATAAFARPAVACGASAGGAPGVSGCSLEEHEEGARPRWRLGADYSFTSTGLNFDSGLRVDETRNASLITLDYRPVRRLTLEVGAGAFLGGSITVSSVRYAMAPGFAGVVGASWRVVDADGAIPFVLLTSQLSYVFVEGVPLGELGVTAGAGLSF